MKNDSYSFGLADQKGILLALFQAKFFDELLRLLLRTIKI